MNPIHVEFLVRKFIISLLAPIQGSSPNKGAPI